MNKSNHLPIRKVYIIYKKSVYQKYVIDEKNKHLQKLVKSRHESAKKLLDTHQKHLSAIETIKSELKNGVLNTTSRHEVT